MRDQRRRGASARMQDIPFSSIRSVFEQVTALRAKGEAPVPFHVGRPDFDTPEHIKVAAKAALDGGMIAYTSNYGLPELRHAIAEKLTSENRISADPEREIIVTVGTNEAIAMIMLGLLDPGDEILVLDPMWLHYLHCARIAGAVPVSIPVNESEGFQPDPAEIEARITSRTRMLIINTPHNPTGAVYDEATLQAIAEIVARYDLWLVSDEIYEKIIYDDCQHISPASIDAITKQTITVNGFSKAYAMTGWRVGYVHASPEIIDVLIRVHQYTTICATSFAQAGAVAALTGPQHPVREMVAHFAERRDVLVEGINAIDGLSLVAPGGAFYVCLNVRQFGLSSAEFARQLLTRQGVAVVPGSAFGDNGEGNIRIAYSCSTQDVRRGVRGLADFVNALRS